ncbi:signal recognition particle-docking protein FtsY [Candidatus Pacearchaeota archaeon]|nr:MAG: signal recognition particle-docking protein FtsY [Candidatus Pacearchaeota archaeon]
MFGALKEKLKGWIKRNKGDLEKEEKKKEKRKDKKKSKEKKKEEKKDVVREEKQKKSFLDRFKRTITEERFEEMFEELELILLQNNVALEAVGSVKESLKKELVGKIEKEVNLQESLKQSIEDLLLDSPDFLKEVKRIVGEKKVCVILFVGINGSGKTTTIAKIANLLKKNSLSVCFAAADTFRAASIEQIGEHAKNLNVPLVKKDYGADPASVGFDAVAFSKKRHIEVVLIDTAGRMQNKDTLMREIEKVSRVTNPDMKIFVGESITGNDVTNQAKAFEDAVGLTGIILSKADVDEKGGAAISVSYVTKKPILFLGTGQGYGDLKKFSKKELIKSLGL